MTAESVVTHRHQNGCASVRSVGMLLCMLMGLAGCGENQEPSLPGAGQWRVINWWAVWCGPCREEIPELNQLAGDPSVKVLGVNFDRKTGDALAEDSRRLGIAFELLKDDPAARLGVPRPTVLPTTLIVSPEGVVVATLVGPQTQSSLRAHMTTAPAGN